VVKQNGVQVDECLLGVQHVELVPSRKVHDGRVLRVLEQMYD
jgi:hypothetical protein